MFSQAHTLALVSGEPNYEQLRAHGWEFHTASGRYCLAWRGNEQAMFVWTRAGWQQLPAQTAGRAAA